MRVLADDMDVIEGEGRIAHIMNSRLVPEPLPATIAMGSSGVISVPRVPWAKRD